MPEPPAIQKLQPRIRHNDYTDLAVPRLGAWTPRLAVSVVIPALGGQEKLDLVLAGLAAQTYPAHLLEVVVVDDGSSPPLTAPELAPERTRIIRAAPNGWGSAHAVHHGVTAADGDVILRLDADVIPYKEHVEAHVRWHHLAGYLVVLGSLRYVDYAQGELSPRRVHQAVTDDTAGDLFDSAKSMVTWAEKVINDTNGLLEAGNRAYRVSNGATISFASHLYDKCGGMNTELVLGGDLEFGYRLAQAGAVFVPEKQALSWHLGVPQMRDRHEEGTRFREPFLSHRVPLRRDWRRGGGRQWLVPYVDVIVDATGGTHEDVRATVVSGLASTLPDVCVSLVGPWRDLDDARRSPLDDEQIDLRLLRESFVHDGRVNLVESVPATSAPTPFRFRCPVGLALTPDALRRLIEQANEGRYGLVLLAFSRGSELLVGRLERTEAFARAAMLRESDEDILEVVHEVFGTYWIDGSEWALVSAKKAADSHREPMSELEKLRARVAKLQKETQRSQAETERWKRESARLKKKLQAPLGEKLSAAAQHRLSRLTRSRSTNGAVRKNG